MPTRYELQHVPIGRMSRGLLELLTANAPAVVAGLRVKIGDIREVPETGEKYALVQFMWVDENDRPLTETKPERIYENDSILCLRLEKLTHINIRQE